MTKIFSVIVLLLGFGLAACNTIEGAGKDIENTGEAVQETANEAK